MLCFEMHQQIDKVLTKFSQLSLYLQVDVVYRLRIFMFSPEIRKDRGTVLQCFLNLFLVIHPFGTT